MHILELGLQWGISILNFLDQPTLLIVPKSGKPMVTLRSRNTKWDRVWRTAAVICCVMAFASHMASAENVFLGSHTCPLGKAHGRSTYGEVDVTTDGHRPVDQRTVTIVFF